MATITLNYGSSNTLTWGMTTPSSDTNLLAGRQSTAVDNETTDKYVDIVLGGSFTGPSTGSANGVIEIYAYGSWDGGTTYTSDATGTDGNLTLVAATKYVLHIVHVVVTNTTNGEVYKWGPISLASVLGGVIPAEWGLWGVHSAGGALQASTTKWQGIKYDVA